MILPLIFKKEVKTKVTDQEFIEFKLECQQYKDRIVKLEKHIENQETRIIELEKRNDKTDFQYEQIMRLLNKLTEQTIPGLSAEIQALKEKPIKRYDAIIGAIISAIIGGVIGFILSRIFA